MQVSRPAHSPSEYERLRSLLNHSPTVVYVCDPNADYATTYITDNVERLTGLAPRAFADTASLRTDRIHADDRARVLEALAAVAEDRPVTLEYRLEHVDGSYLWVRDEVRVGVSDDGARAELWGSWVDVTDYVEAREGGEKDKQTLQSVLDSTAEGIIVVDGNAEFILWNDVAAEVTGLGATDKDPAEWAEHYGTFTNEDMTTLVPTAELPLVLALQGEAVDGFEMYMSSPATPEGVWVRTGARPILDNAGSVQGAVATFHDAKERKRAEKSVRQSEEQLRLITDALPVLVS